MFLCLSFFVQLHTLKINHLYLQVERNMIAVIVFLLILKQVEICSLHKQMDNCHFDLFPTNLRGLIHLFLGMLTSITPVTRQ